MLQIFELSKIHQILFILKPSQYGQSIATDYFIKRRTFIFTSLKFIKLPLMFIVMQCSVYNVNNSIKNNISAYKYIKNNNYIYQHLFIFIRFN